jgi:hypothetical protein
MLITNDIPPIHWALAGAIIAGVTLLLLFLANRQLGISSAFDDLCSFALRGEYFRRPAIVSARGWRLAFIGGLVVGGALSAISGGGWQPTWDLGLFDAEIGWGRAGKIAWMFGGGLLIGIGTRLAGGCTSGHGVFGNATFQPASVISTVSFLGAGMATSALVHHFARLGGA